MGLTIGLTIHEWAVVQYGGDKNHHTPQRTCTEKVILLVSLSVCLLYTTFHLLNMSPFAYFSHHNFKCGSFTKITFSRIKSFLQENCWYLCFVASLHVVAYANYRWVTGAAIPPMETSEVTSIKSRDT